MAQSKRGGRWLRLVAAVAAVIVTVTTLAPLAGAQEDAAPPEETPEAVDLNPADDHPGQNIYNPNAAAGGTLNVNPHAGPPPAAETPVAIEPATDDAEAAEAAGETDQTAAAGESERTSAQGAEPASGEGQLQAAQQPAAGEQPAGSNAASTEAGSGGSGTASGDGGTIIQSAGITGNNRGSEINVNDCAYGSVQIDGGEIINATDIELSANGGVAVSTANGGDGNAVQAGGAVASQIISAGNGGSAGSNANGGTIITGAMITGNNRGHEINFADCPNGRGEALLIIDAGDVSNTTSIDISADGGTAISDASGGDGNLGVTGGLGDAAAGNGGVANSSADGGTIITSAMITGNNRGNSITVGRPAEDSNAGGGGGTGSGGAYSCLGGQVTMIIDGGTISNNTSIDISADGGTAIADASGGDDNIGLGGDAAVGNGGVANSSADGGTIITNAIMTGNNRGSEITVGNVSSCSPVSAPVPDKHQQQAAPKPGKATKQISAQVGGGKKVAVATLPDTGTGQTAGVTTAPVALLLVVGSLVLGLMAASRRPFGLPLR